jgi:hypothetical protein
MRDSDTYLAILDEGREAQLKEAILLLGQDKFGPGDAAITTQLEGITDLDRLKRILRHILRASDWQDLFDTP